MEQREITNNVEFHVLNEIKEKFCYVAYVKCNNEGLWERITKTRFIKTVRIAWRLDNKTRQIIISEYRDIIQPFAFRYLAVILKGMKIKGL